MNGFAHLSFGLLLAKVLGLDTEVTALASLAPDLDFYLSHRGIFHNPLFVMVPCALLPKHRRSFAAGYLSHLLLDLCTPMGVPLLFTRFTLGLAWLEPGVVLFCLVALFFTRVTKVLKKNRRKLATAVSVTVLLTITPVTPLVTPFRVPLVGGRVVSYGIARNLPPRFSGKLHMDSEICLNGHCVRVEDFQTEGLVVVEGYYDKKKKMLVRARPAPVFGSL